MCYHCVSRSLCFCILSTLRKVRCSKWTNNRGGLCRKQHVRIGIRLIFFAVSCVECHTSYTYVQNFCSSQKCQSPFSLYSCFYLGGIFAADDKCRKIPIYVLLMIFNVSTFIPRLLMPIQLWFVKDSQSCSIKNRAFTLSLQTRNASLWRTKIVVIRNSNKHFAQLFAKTNPRKEAQIMTP